jgi:hypothetical protein
MAACSGLGPLGAIGHGFDAVTCGAERLAGEHESAKAFDVVEIFFEIGPRVLGDRMPARMVIRSPSLASDGTERAVAMTFAPASCSTSTTAAPTPLAPPVTSARRSVRRRSKLKG